MPVPKVPSASRRNCLLFAAATLLGGCGATDEAPVDYEALSTEFYFNPQSAVDPSALPPTEDPGSYFYVFRNQSDWVTWAERARLKYSTDPVPSVDFSRNTVAAVYLGVRNNGCYTLSIKEVVDRDGLIVVRYHEGKPGPGDGCTAMVIHPLKIIQIRATGQPIGFEAV